MVRQAFFWTFSGQFINFLIQFGSSVAIARLLSPTELGVFGVAGSVIGVVNVFASFSVANYVIREPDISDRVVDTAFTINALIALGLCAVIFLASFVAGPFLHDAKVGQVMRLLAITPALGIFTFRPNAMLQRRMQVRNLALLGSVVVACSAAVSVVTALHGAGPLSPAYGAIAGGILSAVGTIWVGRGHNAVRVSLAEWRPITAFGLRLMSINGVAVIAVRLSEIIIARLLGLAALGLYNRAANLGNLLFTNVYGVASGVVFAKLSEARRDGDRVTEVFQKGFRLIAAFMAPLNLGLAVLSQPIIHLLYGDKWMGAALPFSLFMIAQFISLSFAMNWELFVVRNELKAQTTLELTRSVVGVVGQTLGSLLNLIAVAASSVGVAVVSVLLYERHMVRLTGLPRSRLHYFYLEAALLGSAAALPPLLLMLLTGWNPGTGLGAVVASIVAGVALWAVAVKLLRHPLLAEVDLLRARFGRTTAG